MVDHVQLQAALAAVVLRLPAAFELILTARHDQQTDIGALKDPVKEGHLDVGLQGDLFLAWKIAVDRIGQGPHPGIPLLQLLQVCRLFLHLLQRGLVGHKAGMYHLLGLGRFAALPDQFLTAPLLLLDIHAFPALQQMVQLLDGRIQFCLFRLEGSCRVLCLFPCPGQVLDLLFQLGSARSGRLHVLVVELGAQGLNLSLHLRFAALGPRQFFPQAGGRLLQFSQGLLFQRNFPVQLFFVA